MAFAWCSRVATWWRTARRRSRAARRPALRVEQLGERALLSGLTAITAERDLVQGLLAGLRDEGPRDGTAGLVVALGGPKSGAGPNAGPVFQFDLKPGGELLVSSVAGTEDGGAAPARPGESAPDRTYLVLIPSDELRASGAVVARLEQEATRSFLDPSGQTLVLEMSRPPFRADDRNAALAARFDHVPPELGDPSPKELSPAAGGEGGPAGEAAQTRGDGAGGLNMAGLAGPQTPQAWTNASEVLSDAVASEAEGDGLAEWAMPESPGQALLPAPDEGPGPAWVELVPLGDNSLSVVPALLAPPAGGITPAGEVGATEWASDAPAGGAHLAPLKSRSEPGPVPRGVKAPPDLAQANPACLPPARASPFPEIGLSWVRDLLHRLVTEREGSSPPEPVLDALFIVGLWEVGQERMRGQRIEKQPAAVLRL
ncbi:MAG TPA: hypothetical protein VFE78_35970 [Gemmataceae bacterium]|nr:hypothetical protein [Gemmataceae bacterium]